MLSDKVIFFWGCGVAATEFIRYALQHENILPNGNIYFTDNNEMLWGKQFMGYPVVPPMTITQENSEYIVIANEKNSADIFNQLVNINHISRDKCIFLGEFRSRQLIKNAFALRYGVDEVKTENYLKSKKIVVYTAIIGNCDGLKEPEKVVDELTYVCFTDNRSVKSDVWNIEYVTSNIQDNRKLAKQYKLFPNKYFKDFDTSIWIDGKFQIKDSFVSFVEKYGKDKSILLFPHFFRNCIYEEAAECAAHYMTDVRKIFRQISKYQSEGYPFQNGLYELGCIARRHNDPEMINLMEQWQEQQNQFSIRDQISLPYVFWKNNYVPDICDLNINSNQWINLYPHNISG